MKLIYLCSPGKGILVQSNGVYYYPGRLISWDEQSLTGTVQMWRGIENDLANKIIHNVPASDIADGLWKDYKGRRQIRVCLILIHKYTQMIDVLIDSLENTYGHYKRNPIRRMLKISCSWILMQ